MLVKNYYGAASAGASPTLFYSMPPPGLGALGGGSMGPPSISAAGFSSALVAAAAAGNPGNMTTGAHGSMMASHHALSATHPLSQSHLAAASHLSSQLSAAAAAAAAHQQLTNQFAACQQQQQQQHQQQQHHQQQQQQHHLQQQQQQQQQQHQHRHKMSTSPKLSYSSMGTTSSTSPSLNTSSSSPTSTSSVTSQQHKKFRPPYTRPSHRAARYIPKPMPQELGHLKTYSSPDILICGNCREMFSDLVDIIEHKKDYCKLRFTCKCDYLNLDSDAHDGTNDSTAAENHLTKGDSQSRSKWLHCVSCKMAFSNAWDLMVHVQTAHMINIYQLSDPTKSPANNCNDVTGAQITTHEPHYSSFPMPSTSIANSTNSTPVGNTGGAVLPTQNGLNNLHQPKKDLSAAQTNANFFHSQPLK